MKKTLLSTLLVAASLAALAPAAQATDGTINFTGSVLASTCTVSTGTNGNFSVVLPPVSTKTLATAGNTAGRTPFSIQLTGCGATPVKAQTFFEAGPTVNQSTGRLTVTGGATNVEIGLLNATFQDIKAGAPLASQNTDVVAITGGTATMNFYAQYVATGAAGAGTANSSLQYTISYQ